MSDPVEQEKYIMEQVPEADRDNVRKALTY
jgi:hypothetical protein